MGDPTEAPSPDAARRKSPARLAASISRRLRTRAVTFAATVVGASALAGCDQRPTEAIERAQDALAALDAAAAAEYAPEAMSLVAEIQTRLAAELTAQDDRSALFRMYGRTTRLADSLVAAISSVNDGVVTSRERARVEAGQLIEQTRVALEETMGLWTTAPTGRGVAADLGALRSDLEGVSALLTEVEAAFVDGRYVEAKRKATLALESTHGVRAALDNVVQTGRRIGGVVRLEDAWGPSALPSTTSRRRPRRSGRTPGGGQARARPTAARPEGARW